MFFRHHRPRMFALSTLLIVIGIVSACSLGRGSSQATTPTPTKTPRPPAAEAAATPAAAAVVPDLPTHTPLPTPAPTSTAAPRRPHHRPPQSRPHSRRYRRWPHSRRRPAFHLPPPPTAAPPTDTPAPQVDFAIAELRALGQGENNGGIEGPGAGRTIFITVVDAAGNPIDGAVIANTAPYAGHAVSGDKGPGKAEILMDREEFRLKIESVSGQPVNSEVSHTMSLIAPEPADIAGKLGDACPTVDNCPLPPYKHFSYAITFRRTY